MLVYGKELTTALPALREMIFGALAQDQLKAALELFNLKQYRGAIATSAVVLEHTLRQLLSSRGLENSSRMSMGQILIAVSQKKLLDKNIIVLLREVMGLRNRAVHDIAELSKDQAEFVISTIGRVLDDLPNTNARKQN